MKESLVIKSHFLIIIMAGYFTLVLNWPFFSRLYGYIFALESYSSAFALSIPVLLFSLLCFLFSLFVVKGLSKLIFIPLLIISAVVSYASQEYGVVFNYGMIENVVETDVAEASSYVNIRSLIYVVLLGLIPAVFVYRIEISYFPFLKELGVRVAVQLCAVLMSFGMAWGFYEDYAAVGRNNQGIQRYINPTEYIYSTVNFLKTNYVTAQQEFISLGDDAKIATAHAGKKPTFMVMALGETARANEYEYNGYTRATNSFTKPLHMLSLGSVESCGTATAVSVPCMFSFLTHANYDKEAAAHQDNVLDVLAKAGVQVYWVDNNSGCKGVCKHVTTIKVDVSATNPNCDGEYCFDQVLLPYLSNLLKRNKGRDTLLVLHLIGSHGPTYYRRYPEQQRFFTPDCARSDIQNCTHEELQNSYDNTIRYTDFVISEIIRQLETASADYDTALVYMSDHGESLGEKGLYLHGLPYDIAPSEQKHVPALVWASHDYRTDRLWQPACMEKPAGQVSQDVLSHSLLGMMEVETALYDKTMDVSAQWRCIERPIAAQHTAANDKQPELIQPGAKPL